MDSIPESINIDLKLKQDVLQKQELLLYRFGNPQNPNTIYLNKDKELSEFYIKKVIQTKNNKNQIQYFSPKDKENIWFEKPDTYFANPMDAIKELILSLEHNPLLKLSDEKRKEQQQLKDGIWKRIDLYQELVKLFNPLNSSDSKSQNKKRKVNFQAIIIESHFEAK